MKYTRIQYGMRKVMSWEEAHAFLAEEANAYMDYRIAHGAPRLAAEDILRPAEEYRDADGVGTAATLSTNVLSITLAHELAIVPQQTGDNPGYHCYAIMSQRLEAGKTLWLNWAL